MNVRKRFETEIQGEKISIETIEGLSILIMERGQCFQSPNLKRECA